MLSCLLQRKYRQRKNARVHEDPSLIKPGKGLQREHHLASWGGLCFHPALIIPPEVPLACPHTWVIMQISLRDFGEIRKRIHIVHAAEGQRRRENHSQQNEPCCFRKNAVPSISSLSLLLFPSQRPVSSCALFPSSLSPLPSPQGQHKGRWELSYLPVRRMNHILKPG